MRMYGYIPNYMCAISKGVPNGREKGSGTRVGRGFAEDIRLEGIIYVYTENSDPERFACAPHSLITIKFI